MDIAAADTLTDVVEFGIEPKVMSTSCRPSIKIKTYFNISLYFELY